jgi:hypothetical protein
MTYRGHMQNGVVVLKGTADLPEGTEVTVRPVGRRAQARGQPRKRLAVSNALLRFAGKAKGLPSDAARNLDHYLYGHPKR